MMLKLDNKARIIYDKETANLTRATYNFTPLWENAEQFHGELFKGNKWQILGPAFVKLTNLKSNGNIIDFETFYGTNKVSVTFVDNYKKDEYGFSRSEDLLYSLFPIDGMATITSERKIKGHIIYKDHENFEEFALIIKG